MIVLRTALTPNVSIKSYESSRAPSGSESRRGTCAGNTSSLRSSKEAVSINGGPADTHLSNQCVQIVLANDIYRSIGSIWNLPNSRTLYHALNVNHKIRSKDRETNEMSVAARIQHCNPIVKIVRGHHPCETRPWMAQKR